MKDIQFPFYNKDLKNPDVTNSLTVKGNLTLTCPHCKTFIEPQIVFSHAEYYFDYDFGTAYIFSQCPNCNDKLFTIYNITEKFEDYDSNASDLYLNINPIIYPYENVECKLDSIDTLSPAFLKIYQQSLQAENIGLNEICGAGYRKAVEFLIRDYLIYKQPNDKEKIVKYTFADCIKQLEEDIQQLASGANWLGSDYVHYSKHHEEYNLDDLKEFIELLVLKIQSQIKENLAKEKINTMQEKRQQKNKK